METNVRELVVKATPKKQLDGWAKGETRDVHVAKMHTGKFCIYKQISNKREPSGYRVYPTYEDLENDFDLVKGLVQFEAKKL